MADRRIFSELEAVKAEYVSGISLPRLSRRYGRSIGSIYYHLQKSGVRVRGRMECHYRHPVNSLFFSTIDY